MSTNDVFTGIWLDTATQESSTSNSNILVLDVEGSDSIERGDEFRVRDAVRMVGVSFAAFEFDGSE